MLKIQEFIFAHENWRELLANAPYNLKIQEDDGFVLFKYNQISSDFHEEICNEARGLILDSQDNFRVVRYAFKKFFNVDEPFAAHIDWDSAVATEKIDGSIMSVWYARGKWHLSTNGTVNAFKAGLNSIGPYKTFGELFESVLPLSTFVGNRYENICWTFELVSPYNKVVIDYPETKVYLLSMRYMTTLRELTNPALHAYSKMLGVEIPKAYILNNENDYRQLVADMPEGHEGIVVRDKNNERVKIKTLLYFQLHRIANNGKMTLERIVDLIKANDTDEFLAYFPEYNEVFADVRERIARCWEDVMTIQCEALALRGLLEHSHSQKVARKQFAQIVSDKPGKALYFIAYDGDLKKRVESYTTPQFIRVFSHVFKDLM